jgi:branched-chain amino acid transport system permease protein
MTGAPRLRLAALVALAVVALAIPFFFGSYRVGQFTQALALAVAVLGLNLLVGYSGQISLGHGAFFALGSYVSAILIVEASVPYLATLPLAGAACFAAGLLFGLPALRLRGLYVALVTLGLAIATPQLIKRFEGLTGGTQGLTVPRPTAPAWTGLADDQFLYLLTLAIAVVMLLLAAGMVRGRVGRALIVVRDNEIAAKTMGVNLATYKTGAFAVSSMYAGIGGALYMLPIGFVAPESFPLALSFGFLAAIVVGGLATIWGAVFGALFIEFMPVYAADVDQALAGVIYGTVLILFMYLLPGGVMGLGRRLLRHREPEPRSTEEKPREAHHEMAPGSMAGDARDAGAAGGGVRTRG